MSVAIKPSDLRVQRIALEEGNALPSPRSATMKLIDDEITGRISLKTLVRTESIHHQAVTLSSRHREKLKTLGVRKRFSHSDCLRRHAEKLDGLFVGT